MLVPGLILAWLVSSLGNAKEPDPAIDSVLVKWEEASHKGKILDAKLTVWRYDPVFDRDHQPTIAHGRFYYEAPNLGRYETRKTARGATNDWSSVSEAVIWTGKEVLWIDGGRRLCRKFSRAKLQSLLSQPGGNNLGWLSEIVREFAGRFQEPKQFVPLLIGIRASEVRERFDVTLEKSGEGIYLRALPRRSADAACYSRIDVILSAKTFMAVATQVFSPNGKDRTVVELNDAKVNQRPSDRDQLLAPDLSGLHVTEDR
jgi:outer membrane lipoprotein-sorting protein